MTKKPFRSPVVTGGTSNFPLVEWTGWQALGDLLRGTHRRRPTQPTYRGLEPAVLGCRQEDRVAWATDILTNLGWTNQWAPVHVFVGHGSHSTNNPHASGLDCGACGGRTGEASARAAAALLNDPDTRMGLRKNGIAVPEATRFVAALHNTTVDSLTFLGEGIPEVEPGFRQLRTESAKQAATRSRLERETRFPFMKSDAENRSAHAAETRPEAGLAGNAVFLAVPRAWTRGSALQGRAFLQSYDASTDDGSVLSLILTAPAIVASWINLQYFASAVAPGRHGAGNKVLHSRIGNLGVLEGNGGDLKAGLPWQSVVFDGNWYHEPLRLQVMVAAPVHRVEEIVKSHEGLRQLVEGRWIILSVLREDGTHEVFGEPK